MTLMLPTRLAALIGKSYLFLFLLLSSLPLECFALTLDDFIYPGSQTVGALPGQTNASGVNSEFALGGTRVLKVEAFGAPFDTLDITATISQGRFASSQDVDIKGRSVVEWDATTDIPSNHFALGGIDLTQDGGNAFLVVIKQQDLPVNIVLEAYDTQGAPASHGSRLLLRQTDPVSQAAPKTLTFPFSSFVPIGPSGGADFTKLGLLRLIIDGGNDSDVDIQIERIATNGKCVQMPIRDAKVVDECGVCAGDNTSCADCKGIPNGQTLPGSACSTGNSGACSTGTYNQNCICTGPIPFDRCGICGGDGKSCIECSDKDQTPILTALDGGAKKQERVIRAILRELKKYKKDAATLKYIDSTQKKTHKLQIRNWTLSWMLPKIAHTCEKGGELCVAISHTPILSEYRVHAEELLKITVEANRRLKLAKKRLSSADKAEIAKGYSTYAANLKIADSIPIIQHVCD